MIIYLRNLLLFNVYVCGLYLLPFGVPAPGGVFYLCSRENKSQIALFTLSGRRLFNLRSVWGATQNPIVFSTSLK